MGGRTQKKSRGKVFGASHQSSGWGRESPGQRGTRPKCSPHPGQSHDCGPRTRVGCGDVLAPGHQVLTAAGPCRSGDSCSFFMPPTPFTEEAQPWRVRWQLVWGQDPNICSQAQDEVASHAGGLGARCEPHKQLALLLRGTRGGGEVQYSSPSRRTPPHVPLIHNHAWHLAQDVSLYLLDQSTSCSFSTRLCRSLWLSPTSTLYQAGGAGTQSGGSPLWTSCLKPASQVGPQHPEAGLAPGALHLGTPPPGHSSSDRRRTGHR